LFDSTQIPGEIVDLVAVRAMVLDAQPMAVKALLSAWAQRGRYLKREPGDAARRMGIRQQTTGEHFLRRCRACTFLPRGKPEDARGASPSWSRADGRLWI